MKRRALITGISGQDGSYLAELLLGEGYDVVGLVRGGPRRELPLLEPVRDRLTLLPGDLHDIGSMTGALAAVRPHELYHLAAPTFVPSSWDDPTETIAAIATGTAALLSAARGVDPGMRIWVTTSSEVFGDTDSSPQDERSAMRPRTPYGVAKLAAHGLVGTQREHFGLFACSGITYNHESPRRPERFVTRKITRGAAAIALGRQDELVLGDLNATRDWCHARDVVRGAWLALQADAPADYVLASGTSRTVGELVETAFRAAGADPAGRVRVDPAFVRPPEPVALVGNARRAREALGWRPEIAFEAMVDEMVRADLAALRA
ncbi:MAG: GDP-mannose 4,6-dehydratase [uncultured Solirubrobacteraceae bacterium]|uniref:GDP-mannose 4,6-dehydratase n=1 Tax=uncultured Solirubrobacteraceae bacterium TaxID=1162706 RepID=A0A6J4RRD3_9ACTN|nr:MAG: GDP-mannose 4,6-dehydratase [uncultured Solirubrobacteraceae bacterium]